MFAENTEENTWKSDIWKSPGSGSSVLQDHQFRIISVSIKYLLCRSSFLEKSQEIRQKACTFKGLFQNLLKEKTELIYCASTKSIT